jgi:chaperonin GroEL
MAFGVLGGRGSRTAIRQRIAEARAELSAADDPYTRSKVTERIGKLAGITVVVRVGAPSKTEQEELKLRIETAVGSARAAVRDGAVPGAGAALLACRAGLAELDLAADERVGVRALGAALCEPMRCILGNAGYEPAPLMAQAQPDRAFDVLRGVWVDPWRASLLDPLHVVRTALQASMSAAMNALLVEVLVHRPNAPTSTEP